MKRFLITAFCTAVLARSASAQTIPLYENFGSVTETPVIDAEAFANYGFFSVTARLPYDFENTRFFTNRGAMTALPGFRFATASSTAPPYRPADTFVNEVGGVVTTRDVAGFAPATNSFYGTTNVGSFSGQILTPSFLLVSADNIINKGIMVAGAAGLLRLNGKNVDVSRSGLGVGRLELSSTHFVTETNFYPDPGIYDNYWALTNQFDMQVGSLLSITKAATNATSPTHAVTNDAASAFPIFTQLMVKNPFVSVLTNSGGADPDTGRITNVYRQAAFVAVSDTNFAIDVKWAPSTIATNPFNTAVVELRMAETNVLTGDLEFSTLYLKDMLASWTNYTVLGNLTAFPVTFRPATYELTRTAPDEFLAGSPGNSGVTNTFFFNPADTNFIPIVTNLYAAYSAQIDSLASLPPVTPGLQISDYPGRVEINADNVDLTRTRLRGTGLIAIHTPNLLSIANANVDSENVIYDLAAPNSTIRFQNVAKERVVRMNGPVYAWSAIWTNFYGIMMTNQVDDGSGNLTNVVTNLVTEIDTHMLIVDATGLQATKPVITHDLITTANDVILSDPMTVVRSLIINADHFTLNSRLTVTGQLENWSLTNAPRLRTFTSKGTLTIPNVANFGQDTPSGYQAFTNAGVLLANGILVRSDSFENSGNITSLVDGIVIETGSGNVLSNNIVSARDLRISANNLRFGYATNESMGTLVLNVPGVLQDTGAQLQVDANLLRNYFITGNGFHLPVKPAQGDLLGTTIETFAPRFARVEHTWAGEDRGATEAGFQNNAALGHLVLAGDRDSLFSFRGATGNNGLYVDLLELTGPITNALAAGDLGSALAIDPSLTIYFARVQGADAEALDGQLDGRLRRVAFAAPSGFVDVSVRSGSGVVRMERAVRESTLLDSDQDGIVNAHDPFPLDPDEPLRLSAVRANNETSILLSWEALPQVSYQVEYTSSLESPDWQPLSAFTNIAAAPQTAIAQDRISGDHAQRYYRVRLSQ